LFFNTAKSVAFGLGFNCSNSLAVHEEKIVCFSVTPFKSDFTNCDAASRREIQMLHALNLPAAEA
jgi:hypothetical protein